MKKKLAFIAITLLISFGWFAFSANHRMLSPRKEVPLSLIPIPHLGQFDPVDYSPQELRAQLGKRDNLIVLDVRSREEYDQGHIPGAIHADYYNAEQLAQVIGDKVPITYCTFSTWRAPYAAYQLYQQGYSDVGVLTGGITAWQQKFADLVTAKNETGVVVEKPKAPFPPQETTVAEAEDTTEINVIARTFEFVPNRIEVRKGQRVILNITSTDVEHGFALPEFGINKKIPAGQTKRIEFIVNRRGEFPFVCSIYCGIDHTSMVGELIVE